MWHLPANYGAWTSSSCTSLIALFSISSVRWGSFPIPNCPVSIQAAQLSYNSKLSCNFCVTGRLLLSIWIITFSCYPNHGAFQLLDKSRSWTSNAATVDPQRNRQTLNSTVLSVWECKHFLFYMGWRYLALPSSKKLLFFSISQHIKCYFFHILLCSGCETISLFGTIV
jgi:hypothetical protein